MITLKFIFLLVACMACLHVAEAQKLTCYKFLPAVDTADSLKTEADSKLITTQLDFNPKETALVIIDFWNKVAPTIYITNTLSLIQWAREKDIPVIFALHDQPLHPLVEVEDSDYFLENTEPIEELFEELEEEEEEDEDENRTIKTLLYAGYYSSECLTLSRQNSLGRVYKRNPDLRFIAIKDCTWDSESWHYKWAVNGIETKHYTTTINDLLTYTEHHSSENERTKLSVDYPTYLEELEKFSLQQTLPPGNNVSADPNEWYVSDTTLGTKLSNTALVLVNTWQTYDNHGWHQRIQQKNEQILIPLIKYAKEKGLPIIHFLNGKKGDSTLLATSGGTVFYNNIDSMRLYLAKQKIKTIWFAGNLTNTTENFSTVNSWEFSHLNGGFKSILVEDAFTVFESPESLDTKIFRKVFLERAIAYGTTLHVTSTTEILSDNTPALALNEVFVSNQSSWFEVRNDGYFPLNLKNYSFSFKLDQWSFNKAFPEQFINPGTYAILDLSEDEKFRAFQVVESESISSRMNHKSGIELDSILLVDSIRNTPFARFDSGNNKWYTFSLSTPGKENVQLLFPEYLCEEDSANIKLASPVKATVTWLRDEVSLPETTQELTISQGGVYSALIEVDSAKTQRSSNAVIERPKPKSTFSVEGPLTFCSSGKPAITVQPLNGSELNIAWYVSDELTSEHDFNLQVSQSGTYRYQLSDAYCLSSTETSSFEKLGDNHPFCQNEDIFIAPNPVDQMATLGILSKYDFYTIDLYTVLGKPIYLNSLKNNIGYGNYNALDFDFSNLEPGMYIVRVKTINGLFSKRLIKL